MNFISDMLDLRRNSQVKNLSAKPRSSQSKELLRVSTDILISFDYICMKKRFFSRERKTF